MSEQELLIPDEACLDKIVIGKCECEDAFGTIEYDSGYPTIYLFDVSGENAEQETILTFSHESLHFALFQIGVEYVQSSIGIGRFWMMPSLDKLDVIWRQVGTESGIKPECDETGLPNFLVNYRLVNPEYGQRKFWLTVNHICKALESLFKGTLSEKNSLVIAECYLRFRTYLPEYVREKAREWGLDEIFMLSFL